MLTNANILFCKIFYPFNFIVNVFATVNTFFNPGQVMVIAKICGPLPS